MTAALLNEMKPSLKVRQNICHSNTGIYYGDQWWPQPMATLCQSTQTLLLICRQGNSRPDVYAWCHCWVSWIFVNGFCDYLTKRSNGIICCSLYCTVLISLISTVIIYNGKTTPLHLNSACCNGLLARYVKFRFAHAPGMPGVFSMGKRSRHASQHVRDARAVMHAGIAT